MAGRGWNAALAAVLAMTAPGAARAGCWSDTELAAARVRDMQSMLMVATLRCQAMHIDVTRDYNAFVQANRAAIETMNLRLKAHFWADGPVEGQRAYDRFTTALANAYGAGDTGADSCAEAAAVSRAAAETGTTPDALERIAAARSIMPALEAQRCRANMVMAAR